MSDKASDHDINEHVHTYQHLITSCEKENTSAGVIWTRKNEFFCTECLNIKVIFRRYEGSWQPDWWIAKEDVR